MVRQDREPVAAIGFVIGVIALLGLVAVFMSPLLSAEKPNSVDRLASGLAKKRAVADPQPEAAGLDPQRVED